VNAVHSGLNEQEDLFDEATRELLHSLLTQSRLYHTSTDYMAETSSGTISTRATGSGIDPLREASYEGRRTKFAPNACQ
jgi:hypothetical protein